MLQNSEMVDDKICGVYYESVNKLECISNSNIDMSNALDFMNNQQNKSNIEVLNTCDSYQEEILCVNQVFEFDQK